MGFTALKQYALNTNLKIICTECDKPQLVYTQKKPHNNISRKFKQINSDLLITNDTTVPELTGNKDFSQLQIRDNLTCLIPTQR